jgi:valyl-tRNA synthetase
VTPAHDKADFDIGLRHGLPQIDIMLPNGVMNDLAGRDLAGLERFKARDRAIELLREAGLLEKEEPYQNNVGYSERAQVPIEPRLSEQWFLKYPSADEARAVVADGRLTFHPERWAKVYDHWMSGLQDWCISRQLWWGHRIPVWYHRETGEVRCDLAPPSDAEQWVQDPDVLDTWFSSWLWPFATMGWPEKTDTLRKFYPTGDLVTGPDIIFFWVARMIMAGFEWMGELPFRNVYFTGIIRDKQGRKMSKSLGNSPDPLDIIAKYGADGLRFGLMRIAPQGQDIRFDEQQIVEGRNFCNKLWNACRFRLMQGAPDPAADPAQHELSVFSRHVLARWDETLTAVNAAYDGYRFSEIAQRLYDFVWGDFCDWFVEMAKSDFGTPGPRRDGTLATIDYLLRRVLLALHPFTPFITEELWHALGFGTGFLDFEAWPESDGWSARFAAESQTTVRFCEAVTAGRNLRAAFNLPSNRKLVWRLRASEPWVLGETAVLATLLNAERVDVLEGAGLPEGEPSVLTPIGDLVLPIVGVVDVDAERKRMGAQLEKVRKDLALTEAKLANPDFVQKVPASVLEEHRVRASTLATQAAELESRLQRLG